MSLRKRAELWVLFELPEDGPPRFSRLLERVGQISQTSLTATLRQLERDGHEEGRCAGADPRQLCCDRAWVIADRARSPALAWAIARLSDFKSARAAYAARAAE